MKHTILAIAACAAAFFMPAQADTHYFRTVVQLQALCVLGGPQPIIDELREKYNEQVVHAMDLSSGRRAIHMYITENKSNPSSTLILHNRSVNNGLGQSCIFWSAHGVLQTDDSVEPLPAKTPGGEKTDA